MWLFIIADAATFGAILFGYGYLRAGSPDWTRPFAFNPTIINGMVMTAGPADQQPDHAGRRRGRPRPAGARPVSGGSASPPSSGVAFAALHLREWFKMFAEGWSLSNNPLGGSVLFGGTFFSITGLHLLHVVGGVVAITVVALEFRARTAGRRRTWRRPGSTGTSSTWCGCSSSRWST